MLRSFFAQEGSVVKKPISVVGGGERYCLMRQVTLTLHGGSGLGGLLTQAARGGVALLEVLTVARAGTGLTLTATSGGLTGVSSTFSVGGQIAPSNPLPSSR